MKLTNKKFALVLGGGSARGLIHAGVLKWLNENDLKPKIIAGTSMGAIIGALYAMGTDIEKIEEIIKTFHVKQLLDIDFMGKGGFLQGKKIDKYFYKLFGNTRFEDLNIKLKINATDFNTGEEVVFTKGKILPAVRASANIPIIFLPYKYKNRLLVDGGVINNLPINQVAKYKLDKYIVVNPYYTGGWASHDKKSSHNIREVIERTIKLYSMSRYTKELKQLSNKIYIRYGNSKINVYDFHKSKQIIQDGYNLAKKHIK